MIEYKFIKGEATLPSGSPAPVKIRKKIQGFKGVQAPEDFKLQIDDKFFYGKATDWIIFDKVRMRFEIVPDARFQKLFEEV